MVRPLTGRVVFAFLALVLFLAACAHPVRASDWTVGKKSLLYIRIDFRDLAGDPVSDRDLRTILSKAETFFWKNSDGVFTIRSVFTPTLRMPQPASFYDGNPDQEQIIRDAREAARRAGFDTARYTFDIVAFRTPKGGDSELAAVGGKGARILNNFRYGITIHALGHNLGLPHSRFWRAAGGSVLGAGEAEEYGDGYDPMGGGGDEDALRHHLVIRSKALLGWLGRDGLANVTSSGRFRLFPQDVALTGLRGLHIPRDRVSDYWVEFRQLITENPKMMHGVRILRGRTDRNEVDLLTMNPGSPHGTADAPLVVGQTFSDAEAGIHITPVALNKTVPPSLDVVVNLGRFPAREPLRLNMTASTQATGPGQTVEFTADVANPGPEPLLYSWDFGDGTFESGHARMSHTWKASGRDYVVRACVTDLKGQSASLSRIVTIGRPSAGKLAGKIHDAGAPLADVRINIQPADANAQRDRGEISKQKLDTTLTGCDGKFYLVGLTRGTYLLRAQKPGYFILPVTFTSPPSGPLELRATKITGGRTQRPRSGTTTLHIRATIDGTDELRITATRAEWKHHAWSWPTRIQLNNVPMDPRKVLPNSGRSAFLAAGAKLGSATVVKKSGRGSIELSLQGQTLVVKFDDPQAGAGDYDLEIEFELPSRSAP